MKFPLPGLLGLIYVASEILLSITKHARTTGKSRDAQSWRLLWIVITLSVFVGIFVAQNFRGAALPDHQFFTTTGVIVFVFGLLFRIYAIVRLGRFFTVNVAIAPDHQLVDAGPYRLIRHPSYTGSLVAFFGLALTLGNWLSLLVMMLPIFAVFVYRMNVEERALIDGLGENYRSYITRTKRLVPFVY
ncbi:MAG: protein-S-isoprenylcysteine methyltransferase [Chthoniobacterales bacterium]|nr:MAG: protein-S-isoprenylcysteine methyltransferase [Chthoniobacterales bacterium]